MVFAARPNNAVTFIASINRRIFMYTVIYWTRLVWRYRPWIVHVVFLHRHTGNIYNARSKVLHHIYFIKYRHQRWSIYDSRNVPSHTRHRVRHRKHIIPMAVLYDCAVLYVTWWTLHRWNHQPHKTDWYHHCYINTVQCSHSHDLMVLLHHFG